MNLPAFPKPYQAEGVITLTPAQRAHKRQELYHVQRGICACGCGRSMSWEPDRMDTAELEHILPRAAGCKKQDADFNLRVCRHDCNAKKGSKRI